MDFIVRTALENEIEIMLLFEKGIIEAERPYDKTLKESEFHYYDLLELIKSTEAEVIVATYNGEIIASGFAKIKQADHYLKHDYYGHLGFMYVKPEFRGHGINQLILNKLINWSKSKGLSEIRLNVYDENIIAKKAYLKAGFKPNILEMRLEV